MSNDQRNAEFSFLDFAGGARHSPGEKAGLSPSARSVPYDDEPYVEPWTGWRLVLAWTIAWLLSAGVLALTVTLAYEVILWAAGV